MTASLITSTTLTPLPRGKNQSLSFVTAQIITKSTQYPANIPPKYAATLPLPSLTGSRKGYAIGDGQRVVQERRGSDTYDNVHEDSVQGM